MDVFNELGASIESLWCARNYNEDSFPAIAAEALLKSNLVKRVDPWDIIRWVHTTPNLPEQMDLTTRFGNPPITLYSAPRFYIDAYYWLDGTTTIHQHAFSGAFQLLLGSSVHSSYQFAKEREVNPHLLTGKILLSQVSFLKRGDSKEINPGAQYIHSLFHLERPSLTITIRTHKAPHEPVQYRYLKPYLAIDPFFTDASLIKKVQTVDLLLDMNHPEADTFIRDLIDAADFHTTYAVLEKVFDSLCHRGVEEIFGLSRGVDRFDALLDRARGKHGMLAETLLPVFEEQWRQREIASRRAQIKREPHRLFLALLLNVPERAGLLKLVKENFPDRDPVDLIMEWTRELLATRIFRSQEPNVLGIPELDDAHLIVLEGLWRGLTVEEIRARSVHDPARSTMPIEDLIHEIKELYLFKPIFCE